MKTSKDIIVMAEEPAKNLTIEYANEIACAVTDEFEIAQLYASVHNKACGDGGLAFQGRGRLEKDSG